MPSSDVAINQQDWKGLPADLKPVLHEAVREFNQDSIQANRELDESFAAKRDPARANAVARNRDFYMKERTMR